jgi:cytochrome c553
MNRILPYLLVLLAAGLAQTTRAAGDPDAGKVIADQKCKSCHNADGNSTDPQYPRLAGQYADYIVKALSDYKSGARKNPIMSGFASGLSEQDQKNVAAWFSSQSGLANPVITRRVEK